MRPHQIVLLIAVVLGLCRPPARAAADACPESCINDQCSTRAQRDTIITTGQGTSFASYNLPSGGVYTRGTSGYESYFNARVVARDRFSLMGPESSGPIAFSARLHLVGTASASDPVFSASVEGSLANGGGTPVTAYASPGGPNRFVTLNRDLSIPIQVRVGETFDLTVTSRAWGAGRFTSAELTGTLSFLDIPPGHWVISCQGFSTGPAVPNRVSTWGSLKVGYR